jgi:methionyl-tRNA formyltransferase
MGTPEFARTALDTLLCAGHEVAAVYTRADKPQGRKRLVTPSPVKLRAMESGIPVMQPATLKTSGAPEELAAFAPRLVVVVAYGLILPPALLALPGHGCINLHASLLPRYRGAAPLQWAVIDGRRETGVSVMRMDEGLDTGPVLSRRALEIPQNATAGEMFAQAAGIAARLLAQAVADIEAGGVAAVAQTGKVSLAPRLDKKMAEMRFALPAEKLHNLVRGCNPWPLAWFRFNGKKIQVLRARPAAGNAAPGEILDVNPLVVACGEGALVLEQVLPEGARAMAGGQWAGGRRFQAGARLNQS